MPSLTLPAPAKLNLFLHIVGRRDDGYHNLQTLFQLLDYGDELKITTRADSQILVTPKFAEIRPEENLVYRAARLLQQARSIESGCDIYIEKRLPMGAGLGGGSSNAATTLVALNRLWNCGLSTAELAALGLKLGADVPLFVEGNSAFAEGVGEQLQPIEIPLRWYLVITPSCRVTTSLVFAHPELTRNSAPSKIRALLKGPHKNDCQAVVEQLFPEVKSAVAWLANFGQPLMTGTGSSVFASFASQGEAEAIRDRVPTNWAAFVAPGVNRSTLYQRLPDR